MTNEVKLLSRPVNFAVVQLPERQYPGVVIQGDSLNALVSSLYEVSRLLSISDAKDAAIELGNVREVLLGALKHYEYVCKENCIPLPYTKNAGSS